VVRVLPRQYQLLRHHLPLGLVRVSVVVPGVWVPVVLLLTLLRQRRCLHQHLPVLRLLVLLVGWLAGVS
jgi:hypothetical protein